MAVGSELTLKKELAAGKLRNLYVLCGKEPYLRDFYLQKIISMAVSSGFEQFNLKKLDGTACEVSDIREAAEQMPLMGAYNCCVVKDFPLASLRSAEAEELGQYIRSVPESTVLIFVLRDDTFPPKAAKDEAADGEKDRKKKRKEMFAAFTESAYIVSFERKSERELAALLVSGAKRRGCVLTPQHAGWMVNLCGNDLYTLLNELEKLCIAAGNGTIDEALITRTVVKTAEATAFEIADNLLTGRVGQALAALQILLDQKTPAQMILGSLIFPFVDMYRIKVAQRSGHNARDLMKCFSYSSSFRLDKAQKNGRNLSMTTVRRCLAILDDADRCLKSRSGSDRILLEETLVKLGAVLC